MSSTLMVKILKSEISDDVVVITTTPVYHVSKPLILEDYTMPKETFEKIEAYLGKYLKYTPMWFVHDGQNRVQKAYFTASIQVKGFEENA